MSIYEGTKDGVFVGLGIVLFYALKNFSKLTLFGGDGISSYPKNTNPGNFQPNLLLSRGMNNIEVLELQKTMNKYNYTYDNNGNLKCVEPAIGQGGYYNYLINENGVFNDETENILFNRYGISGPVTYKQLIQQIEINQGLNNYLKC